MSQLVPLILGDGIGPEISSSVKRIFKAAGVPIEWIEVPVGQTALDKGESLLPLSSIEKIRQQRCALKGPLTATYGKNVQDLNANLFEQFHLFARISPFKTLGTPSRYSDVNFVLISGIEDHSGTISIQDQSEQLLRLAFEYALKHTRKKITLVHHKQSSQEYSNAFLRTALLVSRSYPDIVLQDMALERACFELVDKPERFDILVSTEIFSGILTHLGMAVTGGIALTPCSIVGKEITIFEPVHGTAADITGMGIANPVAMIRAGILLLIHLGLNEYSVRIEKALKLSLADSSYRTVDIKGSADTEKFTNRIIEQL